MAQKTKDIQVAKMNVEQQIKEGDRLLAAGELEKAADAYALAIQQEPNRPLHHCKLGRVLLQQGRVDTAKRCFEQAVSLNAESHLGLYGIAKVAATRKRWEKAIESYQKLIELKPSWLAAVYRDLGLALCQMKRWEEAITCHQKLVQIDKNNYHHHQALGDTLSAVHRYSEAISSYQRVVTLKPNYFWSYYNLGKVFFKVDRFRESALSFESAHSINRDFFDCYGLAALACELAGLKEKALKYWQGFIEEREDSFLSTICNQAREEPNKENKLLLLQLHQAQEKLEKLVSQAHSTH